MIKKNIEFFVADFFFKIRCSIFYFLFKNKKDGYLKHVAGALKNLSHLGCYKIENFYSENQIDYINQIFNKTLDMVDTNQDSKLVIEKTTGEIKIKNIQEKGMTYPIVIRPKEKNKPEVLNVQVFNQRVWIALPISSMQNGTRGCFYTKSIWLKY